MHKQNIVRAQLLKGLETLFTGWNEIYRKIICQVVDGVSPVINPLLSAMSLSQFRTQKML